MSDEESAPGKPAGWSGEIEQLQLDLEEWRTSPKYDRFVCLLFQSDQVTFAQRILADGLDGIVTKEAAKLFLMSTSEAHSRVWCWTRRARIRPS